MIDLKLHPAGKNKYPLRGILIHGASPADWLGEILRMGLSLEHIAVYPLPGMAPNSIQGCLIAWIPGKNLPDFGRNTPCLLAYELVFLPEKTDLFPGVSAEELRMLLLGKKHLFHPELGMVELPEPLRWEELIDLPGEIPVFVRRPEPPVFIPRQVKAFQIMPSPIHEVLMQLGIDPFSETSSPKDRSLEAFDEKKLALLQAMYSSNPSLSNLDPAWIQKMQDYFKDLLQRNKKQIDHLLEILRSDPEEGLKYAIPIENESFGFESVPSEFKLFRRWFNFSLVNSPSLRGGRSGFFPVDSKDLNQLRQQYREIAKDRMQKKDFEKALFIYLKLLKDYHAAARALEKAEHWQEAAAIYLHYLKNREKAAECYEKANMTREAIDLYKELKQYERAGDLFLSIGKQKEAGELYETALSHCKKLGWHLQAASILKNKLDRLEDAQNRLLQGWKEAQDPLDCLMAYFANIDDDKAFLQHMRDLYAGHVDEHNWPSFLRALPYELAKRPDLGDDIRDVAHEIIAEKCSAAPWVLHELLHLQPGDPLMVRDFMRYKANQKK